MSNRRITNNTYLISGRDGERRHIVEKQPLFLLIGGAYGVGKTTIAHQLSIDLHIAQRVGLTGITKSIRVFAPESVAAQNWNRYELTRESIAEKIEREAQMVGLAVTEMVTSAQKDCKNHIMDGVQFLPEYLPLDHVIYVLVTASERERHKKRFESPTITKNSRSEDSPFLRAEVVNEVLTARWKPHGVLVVDNLGTPQESSQKIIEYIKQRFPDYMDRFIWLENPADRTLETGH